MTDKELMELMKREERQRQKSLALTEMIAPLAIGALAGDVGAGVDVGARGFERRLKRETDLSTGERGGIKTIVETDPTTGQKRYRYVWGRDAIGQSAPAPRESLSDFLTKQTAREETAKRMGKGKKFLKNPATGLYERADLATGTTTPVVAERVAAVRRGQTPVDIKRFDKLAKDFDTKTKPIQEAVPSLYQVQKKLENPKNLFANKEAVRRLVTAVEKRLTDRDAAYYTSAVGTISKLRELLEQEATGKMPQRLIDETKESVVATLQAMNSTYAQQKRNTVGAVAGEDKEVFDALYKRLKGSDPVIPRSARRKQKKSKVERLREAANAGRLSKDAQGNYYIDGKRVK